MSSSSSSSGKKDKKEKKSDWSSDLFDCFDDGKVCCCTTCCWPIHAIHVQGKMEGRDLNCKDYTFACTCCYILINIGAWCAPSWYTKKLRVAVRSQLNFPKDEDGCSTQSDACASYCCCLCAQCQVAREVKKRTKDGFVFKPTVI